MFPPLKGTEKYQKGHSPNPKVAGGAGTVDSGAPGQGMLMDRGWSKDSHPREQEEGLFFSFPETGS